MAEVLRHTEPRPMRKMSQRLRERWETMQRHMELFKPDWQDIINYIAPMSTDVLGLMTPGQSRTKHQYDPSAMTASQKLKSHLMGSVTNPAIDWHQVQLPQAAMQEHQGVQQWLAALNRHLLSLYTASNFYQTMDVLYLHDIVFGTGCVFTGEGRSRFPGHVPNIIFTPIPHGTYGILDDAEGTVQTVARVVSWTPVQALEEFGPEHVSQKVRELARDEQQMDIPLPFLHWAYPNEDWEPGSLRNTKMPYACKYMELDTEFLNDESGYWEFPFAVARWQKLSDSPWGFGPGHMALPDTRTMQALKRMQLEMLALWVKPPLKQVFEGVYGAVLFEPLAVNLVRRPDDLTTLDLAGRPDLVQISQEDLRRSINDIFFVTGLEAIPSADDPARTAYEIAQRLAINARLMGPAFHRLTVEALTPIVDRVFGIEWRRGLWRTLPPPAEVIALAAQGGGRLDLEYRGPLARAQKGADAQGILTLYQYVAQVLQVRQLATTVPGANPADLLDDDVSIRRMAGGLDVPLELLRDAQGVVQLRQARAQLEAQMQQQHSLAMGARTLKDMSPLLMAGQEAAA